VSVQTGQRISCLSDAIPWFGSHSGYELLPTNLRQLGCIVDETYPIGSLPRRAIGTALLKLLRVRQHSSTSAGAEFAFWLKTFRSRAVVKHILYGELHLPLARCMGSLRPDVVYTFHLPPSVWRPEWRQDAKRIRSAIVLYRREVDFFESLVGPGRVAYVPYGVDTSYFVPADRNSNHVHGPRIAVVGHWLRDMESIAAVALMLMAKYADLRVDIVVPSHARGGPGLQTLLTHPRALFHEKLTDDELLGIYQQAWLLLVPMMDSGANTAIVEALSCGVPIVTTDVGGIRDYGGNTVFSLAEAGDKDSIIGLAEKYINDASFRHAVSDACRTFAVGELDWGRVAEMHVAAYRQLMA